MRPSWLMLLLLFTLPAAAQNVGIGTLNPVDKLTVQTAPNSYGITHEDGTIRLSTYIGGNINGGYLGTVSNHPLGFYVNNSASHFTIFPTGYMTINGGAVTGFPEDAVTLFGGLTYRNWDGFDQQWTLRTVANGRFSFRWNNITLSYIDQNSGGYFTTSDARLKDEVESYKNVLNDLTGIRVCTYHYKANQTGIRSFGLIAQNVAAHFPELVTEVDQQDNQPVLAIDYSKMGVIAIKAIQEQQIIIQQQQNKIEQLQQRLELLEKKLN